MVTETLIMFLLLPFMFRRRRGSLHWVNDDSIFFFWWTVLLNVQLIQTFGFEGHTCWILTPEWLFRFLWDLRECLYLFWTRDSLFWLESLHPSLCFDFNILCVISACSQIPHVMLCLTMVWKHGSQGSPLEIFVFVQATMRLNQAL